MIDDDRGWGRLRPSVIKTLSRKPGKQCNNKIQARLITETDRPGSPLRERKRERKSLFFFLHLLLNFQKTCIWFLQRRKDWETSWPLAQESGSFISKAPHGLPDTVGWRTSPNQRPWAKECYKEQVLIAGLPCSRDFSHNHLFRSSPQRTAIIPVL